MSVAGSHSARMRCRTPQEQVAPPFRSGNGVFRRVELALVLAFPRRDCWFGSDPKGSGAGVRKHTCPRTRTEPSARGVATDHAPSASVPWATGRRSRKTLPRHWMNDSLDAHRRRPEVRIGPPRRLRAQVRPQVGARVAVQPDSGELQPLARRLRGYAQPAPDPAFEDGAGNRADSDDGGQSVRRPAEVTTVSGEVEFRRRSGGRRRRWGQRGHSPRQPPQGTHGVWPRLAKHRDCTLHPPLARAVRLVCRVEEDDNGSVPPAISVAALAKRVERHPAKLGYLWKTRIPSRCTMRQTIQWSALLWAIRNRNDRTWNDIAREIGITGRTLGRYSQDLAQAPLHRTATDDPAQFTRRFTEWWSRVRNK